MIREMTRQEFQGAVHEISGRRHISGRGKTAVWADCHVLEVEWVSGGVTGGNCWGDEPDQSVYPDEAPNGIDDLDTLLLEVVPDMGFLHYKKLMQLITNDERYESEYYGNHHIYSIKRIQVEDIWRFLCEHELIKEVGGKKLYFCSRFKSIDSKRRKRWFVVATSEQKAFEQATIGAPDGWSGVVGLYHKDNEEMVKTFGKLTKAQQATYKDICANAR